MDKWRDRSRRRVLGLIAIVWMWPAAEGRPAQSGGERGTGSGQVMPEVHGTSFTGEAVELPGMLAGKVGVLVLGFSRESRQTVAEWGRRLAGEYRGSGTVLYYEMPVMAEVPRILRGMVVRSMRKEVPERAQARFVPLLEDEARWKDLAGYRNGDDAYVVVVDGRGRMCGREHGPATEAAFAAVKSLVGAAAASAPERP